MPPTKSALEAGKTAFESGFLKIFTNEIYPGARGEPRMPPPVYKAISDAIQACQLNGQDPAAGRQSRVRPDRRLPFRLQGRADPLMQDRRSRTRGSARNRAASRPFGPRLSNRARERLAGYLFIAPDAIGLMIFVGGPMLLSLSLGFFSVSGFGEYPFVGLDNYRRMLSDPLFWRSLQVTILYVVALVPLLYVVGLGLALLVQAIRASTLSPAASSSCLRR